MLLLDLAEREGRTKRQLKKERERERESADKDPLTSETGQAKTALVENKGLSRSVWSGWLRNFPFTTLDAVVYSSISLRYISISLSHSLAPPFHGKCVVIFLFISFSAERAEKEQACMTLAKGKDER